MNSILELFNYKKMKKKLKKEQFAAGDINELLWKIWDIIGLLSFIFVVTILVLENMKNFNVITVNADHIYKYIVMIVTVLYIIYNFF
jgi:hypothetical protein